MNTTSTLETCGFFTNGIAVIFDKIDGSCAGLLVPEGVVFPRLHNQDYNYWTGVFNKANSYIHNLPPNVNFPFILVPMPSQYPLPKTKPKVNVTDFKVPTPIGAYHIATRYVCACSFELGSRVVHPTYAQKPDHTLFILIHVDQPNLII